MRITDWLQTFVWVCYFTIMIVFFATLRIAKKRSEAFNRNMAESRRLQLEADELFEKGERERALMKLEAAHAALERAQTLI